MKTKKILIFFAFLGIIGYLDSFDYSDNNDMKLVINENQILPKMEPNILFSNKYKMLADPQIIQSSLVIRNYEAKTDALLGIKFKSLGNFRYKIFTDKKSLDDFNQTSSSSKYSLKLANYQGRYVVVDGTVLLQISDLSYIDELSSFFEIEVKNVFSETNQVSFRSKNIDDLNGLLAQLRNHEAVLSARINFFDPNIRPR
jgi:hypothetical protein